MNMAYQALYRTYRPTDFNEMVGQKHILRTLQNAVKSNKIAHAYLFTGPRGTGKTSVARIMAKAVNCTGHDQHTIPCNQCENCIAIQKGTHPDIIEIDAASNNGVDEVRDLIEKVKYAPNFGRYKVYIIDEVHMMSAGAFNALLKTLEEPPEHVLFILATTEPHKILPTIISRCQRFDLSKFPDHEIQTILRQVIEKENLTCDEETIRLISSLADGGMRDALSILDQCIAYAGSNISIDTINEIYGITTVEEKLKLLAYVSKKDTKGLLDQLHRFFDQGIDVKRLCLNLMELVKESIIYQLTGSAELLDQLKQDEAESLTELFPQKMRFAMIETLMECQEKFKFASNLASYFELALLKMIAYEEPVVILSQQRHEPATVSVPRNHAPIAPLQTEPAKSEPVKQAKEIKQAEILNLLVQGNIQDRKQVEYAWQQLSEYFLDDAYRTIARWLSDSVVVASNESFVLVKTKRQMQADLMNDELQEQSMIQLMGKLLPAGRKVFAISERQADEAIKKFVELKNQNALPAPIPIELPAEIVPEVIEETTTDVEQRLQQICGNILEIVED